MRRSSATPQKGRLAAVSGAPPPGYQSRASPLPPPDRSALAAKVRLLAAWSGSPAPHRQIAGPSPHRKSGAPPPPPCEAVFAETKRLSSPPRRNKAAPSQHYRLERHPGASPPCEALLHRAAEKRRCSPRRQRTRWTAPPPPDRSASLLLPGAAARRLAARSRGPRLAAKAVVFALTVNVRRHSP